MSVDFIELARRRFSERHFDSRPVEEEKLALGYPGERSHPAHLHGKRKPLEATVREL